MGRVCEPLLREPQQRRGVRCTICKRAIWSNEQYHRFGKHNDGNGFGVRIICNDCLDKIYVDGDRHG